MSLSFTYQDQPNAAPALVELAVAPPGPLDYQPRAVGLAGRIVNEGNLAGQTVEFDYDGDGLFDGTAQTDKYGKFSFTPVGLAYGNSEIHVRTRELDEITRQFLYGPWTAFSFDNVEPVNQAAVITTLALAHDTGTDGDGISTDDTLTGQITNDGLLDGVTIQFDLDNDDASDGEATTDEAGLFTFQPADLAAGQHTVRARSLEYSGAGVAIEGAWHSVTFTLVAAADPTLRVDTLSLSHDTGDSDSDGATDNPAIEGTVVGSSVSGVSVQIDIDGDGQTDVTTTTDSSGHFSVTPANLVEGRITAQARVAPPDGGTGGDMTLAGDSSGGSSNNWKSLSFVYSSDPDGATAQLLVTSFHNFDQDWQAAQNTYDGTVATANSTYRGAYAAAVGAYNATLSAAGAARATVATAATATFNAAKNLAERAYVAAVTGDGTTFTTNLANFTGDTSSFTLPDFQWPDAPVDNSLIIPDDSSQATPPGTSPNYDFTPFDWNAEKAYLSAVQGKAKLRDDLMLAANATFAAAQKDANDAYNLAKGIIETAYENNIAGAETAYKNALVAGTNPVDMVAERAAYNAKAQQARDTYDLDLRNSADKFGQESAALLPAYMLDMVAINATYLAAMIAAGPHSVDPGELHDSLLRMANVNIDWTAAVEGREVQYATDQAGYAQDRAGRDAKALYKRDKALADLQDALDLSQAAYDYWNNQRTINAQKVRTDAIANFVLTREQALSEKARLRDNDIATARQVQAMSVATAAFDYTKGVAELRQVELHNYVDFQQTQAATYEMEVADHQVTYLTSLRPEYLLHEEALSGATKTEEFAQNLARKVQADSIATAERDRAVDGSLALKKLQDASNLADMSRAGSNAYIWRTQDLARASAEKQNSLDLAAAQRNLSVDNAEASAAYEVAKKVVDRDYVYATDQAGQAAKAAELVVQQKVYSDAQADATFTYFDSSNTAQHDRADRRTLAAWNYLWSYGAVEQTALNSVNGAYTTFDVDVATADRKQAVAQVAASGVYNVSLASADLTWWETAAPADEDYADQDAGFTETQSDADTASQEDFQLAVATGFRNKIQTWSQSQNTPWATYRLQLAQDELDQVASQGEADLEQAESLSSAEVDRAEANSLSAKDRALAEAAAYLAQVVSVAAANNTLAEQSGDALVTEATTVANATATHDGDMIYRNLIYQDVVDDEQKTLQYALDDAWAAYMLGLDEANRDRAKNLIDDTTLSSRTAAATLVRLQSEATAEESRANDLAEARQSWIHDTGVFNFDLADAIAGAANTRAGTVLEKTDEFADTRATAAKTLGEALAKEARDAGVDGAAADAVYSLAASEAASPFAVSSDEASSTGRKADALARADYEIALYTAHKNKLATAATSENTPLATYQASVALADLTRATSDRAGLVTDQDALSEASADETGESNDAREAQVAAYSGEGGVDLVYAEESAAAEKAVSIGYANAQADRVQEETHALAVETKDETAANVKYQKALAADRALLDDSLAGVSVTWVSSMAYGKATLHAHPADSEAQYEYDFTQEAADLTRYDDSRAAAVDYAGNVGDDQIMRAEDLGDALIAAATALGQAGFDFTSHLNTADGIYETSQNAAEATRDSSSSTADLAYHQGVNVAAHGELEADNSASVIYQGVQGTSSVVHAGSTALAEATYQIAIADQTSIRTATWAAVVGTGTVAINGAKAAAIAAWTTLTGPAFTSFMSDEAQADATHDAALAQDAAELDDEEDADSESHGEAVVALSATHDNATRNKQRAFDAGQLTREDARETAFSQDDKDYAIAYATDAKLYAVAVASAERTYQVALAGLVAGASTATIIKAKADALADLKLAQVIRQADADKKWLDDKTDANSALVAGTAPARATLTSDLDALDEDESENIEAHDVALDAADAADEAASATVDETAADDWESAQTAAADSFIESEDAGQTSALSNLASAVGTPFAQFRASMASTVGAWWTESEPAQAAWTTAKNAAATLYETTVFTAESANSTAVDAADSILNTASAMAIEILDDSATLAVKGYALALVAPTAGFIKANTLADRNQKVALATSERNKAVGKDADGNDFGNDQFTAATTSANTAAETAKRIAASAYATAEAAARGAKLESIAAADLQFTVTVGAAQLGDVVATTSADKGLALAESAAGKLLDTTTAAIDALKSITLAQSLAAALSAFSTSNGTPWAQAAAATAQEEADEETAAAGEEEAQTDAKATAEDAETLAEETAAEAQTDAVATAKSTWAHDVQNAYTALVTAQAEARNSLAAGGNFKPTLPILPKSRAGQLDLSITPAAVDDYFGSGLVTTDLYWGYDQFDSFVSQIFGTSPVDVTNTGATTPELSIDRLRERVTRGKISLATSGATVTPPSADPAAPESSTAQDPTSSDTSADDPSDDASNVLQNLDAAADDQDMGIPQSAQTTAIGSGDTGAGMLLCVNGDIRIRVINTDRPTTLTSSPPGSRPPNNGEGEEAPPPIPSKKVESLFQSIADDIMRYPVVDWMEKFGEREARYLPTLPARSEADYRMIERWKDFRAFMENAQANAQNELQKQKVAAAFAAWSSSVTQYSPTIRDLSSSSEEQRLRFVQIRRCVSCHNPLIMRGASIADMPESYRLGAEQWIATANKVNAWRDVGYTVDSYNSGLRAQHADLFSGKLGGITFGMGLIGRKVTGPMITTIGSEFGLSPEESIRVAGIAAGVAETIGGIILLIPTWGASSYLILDGVSMTRGAASGEEYDFMGKAWEDIGRNVTGSEADGRTTRALVPLLFAGAAPPGTGIKMPMMRGGSVPVMNGGALAFQRSALAFEMVTVAEVPVMVHGSLASVTIVQMSATGPGGNFNGGSHRDMSGSRTRGDGLDSNHSPADSVSPLSREDGPAFQMEPRDHRRMSSTGSSAEAKAWRQRQKELIDTGRFREAAQMDIDEARRLFGNKYDKAIREMLDYMDELGL